MNKLKTKLENTSYKFSKNFLYSLIFPAVLVVLTIIIAACVGFNKSMDFKGGLMVSVMSETANFDKVDEYNSFKEQVDDVLKANGVKGSVYTKELDATTYNNVLVVKIEVSASKEDTETLANALKGDLVQQFYPALDEAEINNRHLIVVSDFNGFVSSWTMLATALASLVAIIAVCVYMGFRVGLHAGVLGAVVSIFNLVLTYMLILVTRVKLYEASLAVTPFVVLISLLGTYLFERRAKRLLKANTKYEKANNYELADDAVKHGIFKYLSLGCVSVALLLVFGLINACNPIVHISLAFIEAILIVLYTMIMVVPGFYAMTYVRQHKKVKVKQNKKIETKLDEVEILKETDLDNLTSN